MSGNASIKELYDQYVFQNYGRAPIAFARAEGSRVWDADGKRYLDLLPGLGVNGLGHCPPRVVAAIQKQAAQLLHVHNNYYWESQALLARALAGKLTGIDKPRTFVCNSGTEASEAAIKLARLWGRKNGSGKWKLISVSNGFHGRSYGALTATGQTALQKWCGPLLPGFSYVPLNDIKALESAFDDDTVGFMIEPVQGEGGIFASTTEYLHAAREICSKHGALLMYDEVQCGMGRTGDYFAYQTLKAPAPDIIWLAKALGGGFPIGAVCAKSSVAECMVPGTHGSTFGGNPLACVAALAVIETIDSENLIEHVRLMTKHLAGLLENLGSACTKQIQEIRQVGLMAGIDLKFAAKPVYARLQEEGLLANVTHDTTVRLLPAMNVSRDELNEGFGILERVLKQF